jgi:hypothetical protein
VQQPSRGRQRRPAVVAQGRPHGDAVAAHDLPLRVVLPFGHPLALADAADTLLPFLLGVAIRRADRLGGLAQVVELA